MIKCYGRYNHKDTSKIVFFIILLLYLLCILSCRLLLYWRHWDMQDSAKCKGHFALYNCLVLGHTKYTGPEFRGFTAICFLQNDFILKTISSHRMDLVMIWPPGIDDGAFVLSPETVWYARVLLLLDLF